MAADDLEVSSRVILKGSGNWDMWISIIRKFAKTQDVWEHIDPGTANKTALTPPAEPTASEAKAGATNLNELSGDDLRKYEILQARYRSQLHVHKDKKKALVTLQEHIVKTVGSYYSIIAKEDDVAKELTILKNRIKPTDWARETEITDQYYATLKAANRTKIEAWVSKWQVILNEAKNLDLPDVKGLRPTRHFLKAVSAIDPTFSKYWINRMEGEPMTSSNDDWQKTFPDGIKISEIFERSYRTTSNSDTKGTFATFQGEGEPDASGTARASKPNSRNPGGKPICLCGRRHFYSECYYLSESMRPGGWSPDSKVQEEIDQKLQDPTIKGKVERSIRNRVKKEEQRQQQDGSEVNGTAFAGAIAKIQPEAPQLMQQPSGPRTKTEAVTADGRALIPGIIFKGKELQKQWFLEEFKKIADWYYITSPNGWTDDHIGVEWLERVYLPQTMPADDSDARLIILDGHGSHGTDEWMATCFLNNVYCCYLPAHCSHGLQPLDNGVFNASKAAYRRELEKFASLTDSTPIDKVNFIRAYAKARRVGMTEKNILSGWRVTGNWPISRAKALRHPEIQEDRPNGSPRATPEGPEPTPYFDSDDTPKTSRQIRDLGLNKTPKTRRRYNVIAKGFEAQQQMVAAHTARIASLEEELARLKRGKKRKAVPNANKRFMTLGETLAGGEAISEEETQNMPVVVEGGCSGEPESESEAASVIEVGEETIPHQPTTRSGRVIKRPRIQ